MSSVLGFALIVSLLVVAPGPSLFLLLKTVPAHGRSAGLANTLGFSAAILCHGLFSLLGVSAIIATSALAFSILKLVGAAYLIWLGIKALHSAWTAGTAGLSARAISDGRMEGKTLRRAFLEGWLTNLLNPKPALFYFAAFPQFIDPAAGAVLIQGLGLTAVHATIAAIWYGSVAFGIGAMRSLLGRSGIWRGLQSCTGVILVGLGVRLAIAKAPGQ